MLTIEEPKQYRYALDHLGFRPFFLAGALYAVVVVALWFWLYHIDAALIRQPGLTPLVWHGHEMIYGYALAVIAGFLLTAVRNWTGVQTLHGPGLLALAALWLVARVMPFIDSAWSLPLMALLDLAFMLGLSGDILRAILKTRQWQQIGVLAKVLLLLLGNVFYYLGMSGHLESGVQWGLYTGLYIILSLVLVMGRRVMPFFIEKGVGYPVELKNRGWLDITSLVLMLSLWIADVFARVPWLTALVAGLLCVLHAVRLAGWYTPGIWKKQLLWVLYLAYVWIIAGFALRTASALGMINPLIAVHAFAYGGIAIITIGMMARVSLGHTGRNVFDPPAILAPIFLLLLIGSLARVVMPLLLPHWYAYWIGLSQIVWIIAFAMFSWKYAPMLIRPRVDGRYG
ncbi:MAG TPA: NnrS family protein [Gammaproteobacteria bacterium]